MKWEYGWEKIEATNAVVRMKQLGEKGWDVYFVEPMNSGGWQVWLKRPVGGWKCPTCQTMHDAMAALA